MINDRRKFIRFSIPLDMEFKLNHSDTVFMTGKTINFSREGFCFETEEPVAGLNHVLELNIKHPETENLIPVTGEIVWKEKVSSRYMAGIKLKEMDKAAKSEILDYAYNIWLDKMHHQNISN